MCTIITVDSKNWIAHKDAIVRQINDDAICNRDGWSLVVCRVDGSLSVESMDLAVILAVLNSLGDGFGRFWLHARAATGTKTGVAYCHGFRTKSGLLVQHNGIISNPDGLPVDSMRIGQLIDTLGVESTIEYFYSSNEMFFNTFIIEPEYGEYHVVRTGSGSLYTNADNSVYSTKEITGVASLPVPAGYWKTHGAIYVRKAAPTANYPYSSWDDWRDTDSRDDYWRKPTTATAPVSHANWYDRETYQSDRFFDRLDRCEYLTDKMDDFYDDWVSAGYPELTIADLDNVPDKYLSMFTFNETTNKAKRA